MSVHGIPTRRSRMTAGAAVTTLFLLVSPLACERSSTSDIIGPSVYQTRATVGSRITSSVVSKTTMCRPTGDCHTRTSNSTVVETVGPAASQLRIVQSFSSIPPFPSAEGDRRVPSTESALPQSQITEGELTNVHVKDRTLSADRVKDGHTWHLDLTRDAVATGKVSAIRFYLDGNIILAANTKWNDVAGTWYRGHKDLTFYHEGKVAVHEERTFSPISVQAASPGVHSGLSAENLTLSAYVHWLDIDDCPYNVEICTFFQSSNPLPILGGAISGLASVAGSISNFFNSLWANAEIGVTASLAETAVLTMEAIQSPSLLTITAAIVALASGPISAAILEDVALMIAEWLCEWLWLFIAV